MAIKGDSVFQPVNGNSDPVSQQFRELTINLREIINDHFRRIEEKVDELHAVLAARRKDNYVVGEVAEMTGRSEYTIRRWITEGRLSAIRISDGGPRGRLLVPRVELERLIATARGRHVPESTID